MREDIAYAVTLFRRSPALSALAALALAIGIASTTALFSVVHAVLLRPLPYADPGRLVAIEATDPASPTPTNGDHSYVLTGAEAQGLLEMTDVFAGVSIQELWTDSWQARYALTAAGDGERLRGALVDANLFEVLGVTPVVGRTLAGTPAVSDGVVISHGLWRRRFGQRMDVVGQTVPIDGVPRPILGVLPERVRMTYPLDTDIYLRRPDTLYALALSYQAVARLAPGVSVTAASTALERLTSRGERGIRPRLVATPLRERHTAHVERGIWMVATGAGVLCLAGASNAALLLLTRTLRRSREMEIRLAMGASRWRVLRMLITEHAVVGVAGIVAAFPFTRYGMPFLLALAPPNTPRLDEVEVHLPAFLVAVVIACLSVLLTAVASYLGVIGGAVRPTPGQLGVTATVSPGARLLRRALLVSQVALTLVLLSAATLLLQSFLNVWRIDLGFNPSHVITAQFSPVRQGAAPPQDREAAVAQARRLGQTLAALRAGLAGAANVEAVALAGAVPMELGPGYTFLPQSRQVDLRHVPRIDVAYREVSAGYFDVMRIPLLAGRTLTQDDVDGDRRVMVFSRALASRMFPNVSPLGQIVHWDEPYEVIGVVGDVRWERPEEPGPPTFYKVKREGGGISHLMIRTTLSLGDAVALVRGRLRAFDPDQPIDRIDSLSTIVNRAMAERQFYAATTNVFAVLALVLAVMGVAGGVTASVTERMRAIGIRMALGASRWHLRWYAMREGMVPVALGMLIGAAVSTYVVQALRAFLFELSPFNPASLGLALGAIAVCSGVAAWLPARRALRITPSAVLREE
ncbi:ABC transporter permease [Luteitalea sp.]|uniref:ABC transporter permease n=1 Tax=Luteitalea sp. TaxID=2004800 RepID=UPI0025BBA2D0|nr:ABC transporter permease [Luteitalea sp.]